MTHAVDVLRVEREVVARREDASAAVRPEGQAILGQRPLDHVYATRRSIVVVEARLLVVQPTEQPALAVVVTPQPEAEPVAAIASDELVDLDALGCRTGEQGDLLGLERRGGQQVGEPIGVGHGGLPRRWTVYITVAYVSESSVSIQYSLLNRFTESIHCQGSSGRFFGFVRRSIGHS